MSTEQHRYDPDWDSGDSDLRVWWSGRPAGRPDLNSLPVCRTCRGSERNLAHAIPGEPPRDYWAEYQAARAADFEALA